MDCKQFREVINLYIDGELSSGAAASASLHRTECPVCAVAASDLKRMQSTVRSEVARVAVPVGLLKRLDADLDAVS